MHLELGYSAIQIFLYSSVQPFMHTDYRFSWLIVSLFDNEWRGKNARTANYFLFSFCFLFYQLLQQKYCGTNF